MEIEDWDDIAPDPKERKKKVEKPMDVPESPTEIFFCTPLKCRMQAHHCPTRQLAYITVGGTHKRVIDIRKYPCSKGTCVQGRKILRQPWAKEQEARILAEKNDPKTRKFNR